MVTFEECINNIVPASKSSYDECRKKWNNVAKPLGSLGLLEEITCRMAAATENEELSCSNPFVLIFCADNGVVEEGISQSDHSVTTAVAESVALGQSNINLMSRRSNGTVLCYDVGMIDTLDIPQIITNKIKCGTDNLCKGPAMTKEEAVFSIEVGINAAIDAKEKGADILAVGEMGIGNTTSSAAVLCALTGKDARQLTGRGSGLSDEGLKRKINVIGKCLEINKPDSADALDVLSKCGGFDIAAMAGAFLGAAYCRMPIVIDGLISAVAANIAMDIKSESAGYMLASHVSREPAGKLALERLGLEAPIDAKLALGEGTGAVLLFPLIQIALDELYGGHSFDSIGVDAYTPQK